MKKYKRSLLVLCLVIVYIAMCTSAYAASNISIIENGNTHLSDWIISNQTVRNDGTIKGDMISASQNVSTSGVVEGDYICIGTDIYASGLVLGNMRSAGGNINIDSKISKNVNVLAEKFNVQSGTQIGGNLLALSKYININGKVNGYTNIAAVNATLGGEFLGDVYVFTTDTGEKNNSKLTILPGTKIHGKLTYKGANPANIDKTVQIGSFQWVDDIEQKPDVAKKNIWNFIKLLLSTIVYFLISMLIYKLFPLRFRRQSEIISKRPLYVIGTGIVASLSIILFAILIVVIVALSILIMSPFIGILFTLVLSVFYLLLFFMSTMPVSLWLGDVLLKDKVSLPYRFGIGLSIITFGLFFIQLLSALPRIGTIFSLVSFVIALTSVLVGVGALLYSIRDMYKTAK